MSRSEILKNSVEDFYRDPHNSEVLCDILEKRNGISLRNLEWFITNYAKKNHTTYKTGDGKVFSVHCAYKSSLLGYSKKLFDPFCRAAKIIYTIPGTSEEIHTTVAQLNFIKWCIKNDVIHFVTTHKSELMANKQET